MEPHRKAVECLYLYQMAEVAVLAAVVMSEGLKDQKSSLKGLLTFA